MKRGAEVKKRRCFASLSGLGNSVMINKSICVKISDKQSGKR